MSARPTRPTSGPPASSGASLSERYGVRKGDRIVIAMRNLPEWSIAFWAGQAIGAVVAPLDAWGLGPELAFAIQDCGAQVAFVDGERLERLKPHLGELDLAGVVATRAEDPLPPGVMSLESLIGLPPGYATLPDDPPPDPGLEPDDDATILYTSGTTGRPKGAVGTHRNILTNLVNVGFGGARSAVRRGDHADPRRREHLLRGDRGRPAHPPGGDRRGGDRPAPPHPRRGGRRGGPDQARAVRECASMCGPKSCPETPAARR